MGDHEFRRFSIPDQKPGKGSFLTDPRQVATWVEDLPITNVGETARKLYQAIYDFNQLAMPANNRLKIAELMVSPTFYICNNLEKFFTDAAFPLSEKARKVALLTRALYSELAVAYKAVLQALIDDGIDKKAFAFAGQRALLFTLMMFRQSALTYRNYPKTVWRDVHLIYHHASSNQADRIPIKDPSEKSSKTASVNDLYKQVLLFYLSDHYRLRQRDIQNIYNHLSDWSNQARLTLQARERNPRNQFVIRLNRNSPPIHISLALKELRQKHAIILDTGMLEESLREMSNKAQLNNLTGLREVNGLSEPVIQHLHDVWSVIPERHYSRTQLNFELHIAVGLSAIHALIMQHQKNDPDSEDSNWPLDTPFANFGDNSDNSDNLDSGFWEQGLADPPSGLSSNMEQVTMDQSVNSADIPNWTRSAQSHQTIACKTLNESAGGYCVSWTGKNIPKIKIGELVGIRSASRKDRYALGITRWMKYEKGKIMLGVAIISPSSKAVEARLVGEHNAPARQCLLLSGKKGETSPSLIIPPLAFRTDQTLSVMGESGEMRVRLGSMADGSGAFNRFNFSEAEQPDNTPIFDDEDSDAIPSVLGNKVEANKESGFAKDDSGFDTVWSVL